jgi:uncharacterized protein
VAANLKGRLARIRELGLVKAADLAPSSGEAGAAPAAGPAARGQARGRPSFLEGWEPVGDLAWKRSLRFENRLPESLDPSVFAPLHRRPSVAPPPSTDRGARVESGRLRFFDLETTGLSGGTGTVAFLAAVGRVFEGEFELTQIFLEDYPGEGAFLAALLPLLGGDSCLVSYNGKAFDLPLLRTRCVMNAIPLSSRALHIDALFASRRLWKRVYGGASLGFLEREVLGIERMEDLPGAMIPEVWLSFAKTGESPLMRLVFSHNADDVVGLARLVARAQAIFDEPRASEASRSVDRFGLGRSLLAAGRAAEGEELLDAAAADGDERAGLLLCLRWRRSGRGSDALRVAMSLPPTYRGAVERAKLYERGLGELVEAGRWAREALRLAARASEVEAATLRLRRIERKLSREG